MISTKPVVQAFREGDQVILALGSHLGTLGVFVRLRPDVNWAEIREPDGNVRSHPIAWLAHVAAVTQGSAQ